MTHMVLCYTKKLWTVEFLLFGQQEGYIYIYIYCLNDKGVEIDGIGDIGGNYYRLLLENLFSN